ncbi:hypothetical protein HPB52_017939 [Rhipicephalus sanguineus]|uniref:DDE Tnp4 domain-containing protein n=1 Tax=Rhipicephalus sanguineus TaxID=34632 RepID=A0A9D4T5Z2_RHISA|nr:hypothetical protein HPB52_017939 [Rhipicephalus sanguineus]
MVRSSILWDHCCLAYLSWEDIKALMLREKEPPRHRVYASRGGLPNLDSMSSQCFRRQFRFEKADFPVLVRALKMPQYITSAQGLDEPYPGRRHDAGILRDSQLYEKLEALALDKEFVIYGDPTYPLRPLLMKPYGGAALTAIQQEFNSSMSAIINLRLEALLYLVRT